MSSSLFLFPFLIEFSLCAIFFAFLEFNLYVVQSNRIFFEEEYNYENDSIIRLFIVTLIMCYQTLGLFYSSRRRGTYIMPVLNFTPQSFVHIHICVCICIYMCIMHMRRNTIFTHDTHTHTHKYTHICKHIFVTKDAKGEQK